MKHRLPPKPYHYLNPCPGICKFCGEAIMRKDGTVNSRAFWHKGGCLTAYKTMYWPAETRKAVWKRDQGQCAHCLHREDNLKGNWHVDHIRPLIEANGDLDYWRMENLNTLCLACHAAKTSAEATARASARRQAVDTKSEST